MEYKTARTLRSKFAQTPAGSYLVKKKLSFYIEKIEGQGFTACVAPPPNKSTLELCEQLNNDLELGVTEICPYPILVIESD